MSVELDTKVPARFDRSQLALRVLLAVMFGWLGITLGWMTSLLYVLLPALAAGAIWSVGSATYLRDFAPQLWDVITWFVHCEAYMMLLVDRFPSADDNHDVTPKIAYSGTPTAGSAVLRLVAALPSACVLALLMVLCAPLWVISVVIVLAGADMPGVILAYQRGVLRWQLRLLAYVASFVAEYPPWHLHGDIHHPEAVAL